MLGTSKGKGGHEKTLQQKMRTKTVRTQQDRMTVDKTTRTISIAESEQY